MAEVRAAAGRCVIDQTAAEMRADGLTKRGISRKMGTYVRITAPECERNEDGEKSRRGFEEEKMAFS